jgi:GTP cyclohydrolase II
MNVSTGPKIRLPTRHGDFHVCHVCVHQEGGVFREGVALQNTPTTMPILARVQSSCLFSETFWATDCDCALQLQSALDRIAKDGGTVLYFYEEGRGAGLEAKFKAIELQQMRGLDTKQAYECLKMSVDQRSYEAAAAVLLKLHGSAAIRLLTNNPSKVTGLRQHGLNVVDHEPLICGWEQPTVRRYLQEKATLLGHEVPEA